MPDRQGCDWKASRSSCCTSDEVQTTCESNTRRNKIKGLSAEASEARENPNACQRCMVGLEKLTYSGVVDGERTCLLKPFSSSAKRLQMAKEQHFRFTVVYHHPIARAIVKDKALEWRRLYDNHLS
jgi:hypothetical protein